MRKFGINEEGFFSSIRWIARHFCYNSSNQFMTGYIFLRWNSLPVNQVRKIKIENDCFKILWQAEFSLLIAFQEEWFVTINPYFRLHISTLSHACAFNFLSYTSVFRLPLSFRTQVTRWESWRSMEDDSSFRCDSPISFCQDGVAVRLFVMRFAAVMEAGEWGGLVETGYNRSCMIRFGRASKLKDLSSHNKDLPHSLKSILQFSIVPKGSHEMSLTKK